MTTYLEDMRARVVAMEIEACAITLPDTTTLKVDAVPIWIYKQDSFPYWVNRISAAAYNDYSTEESRREYTLTMRLVIGRLTSGYTGQTETLLDQLEPAIVDFFYKRPQLTCTAFPTAMRYLSPETAQITASANGLAAFQTNVEGVSDVGMEWTLVAPVIVHKDYKSNG